MWYKRRLKGNWSKKSKCRNSASVEYETLRHASNMGATGIVTKRLKQYVETKPEKHSVD